MRQEETEHGLGMGGVGGRSVPAPPKPSGMRGSSEEKAGTRARRQSEPVTPGKGLETRGHISPVASEASAAVSTPSTSPSQLPDMAPGTPTGNEASHDVYQVMQLIGFAGRELADSFTFASEQPPITPESLAELDMPRIINNPKLRHDVNFDRELHFRPNLDGSKGTQKLRSADVYWKALQGELYLHAVALGSLRGPLQMQSEAYWQGILVKCQRLPKIFQAIGDILKTLVPDYDQKAITERLDVGLIMQEIRNGVCDLVDLAAWLARVIKRHCAPMRDHLVNAMEREIQYGAWEGNPEKLVNGLRQLLNILEAMKLDVANHQIRHMRPLLVDDTVNFQRRYNAHRISMNKIDMPRSRLWLEYEMAQMTSETNTPTHLEGLVSALLRGLLYNEDTSLCPQTFYLDVERLHLLRLDLHQGIYQKICRDILVETAGSHAPKAEIPNAVEALQVSISAIVGASGKFEDRIPNIASEITRIVLMLERVHPPIDAGLLEHVEHRLEVDVQPVSIAFERYATELTDRLLPKLQASVVQNIRLPALQLQDKFVPPPPIPLRVPAIRMGAIYSPIPVRQTDPDDDIVRRFTHTVVLHWQVWADLVYIPSVDEADTPASSRNQSPSNSPSSSPTIPVAQAIYAPGRKWLPIGVTVTEVPSGLPTPAASPPPQGHSPPSNAAEQGDGSNEQSTLDPDQQQPA